MDAKKKKLALFLLLTLTFGVLFLYHYCARNALTCDINRADVKPASYDDDDDADIRNVPPETIYVPKKGFSLATLDIETDFNVSNNDVIVFLHIQKTGGTTFGHHLVRNMDLDKPCVRDTDTKKRYDCPRPGKRRETWLFSRFSTGWSCGLHADWTELKGCVPSALDDYERKSRKKRRYFYITMLREPTARYLSEWRHVRRGATWKGATLTCNGRSPTTGELPSCYGGRRDWTGVSLQEFTACPHNLANNRQTRMLADLSKVGCYNRSVMPEKERDRLLLESAKTNLRRLNYFGLTEYQAKSQHLFERAFHLKFLHPFEQLNGTAAAATQPALSPRQMEAVRHNNQLDLQLYEYARDLFLQRHNKLFYDDQARWNGVLGVS